MKEDLSKQLLNFVVKHVDSVELIEVLVLLHSQSDRSWSVADVDAVIRSNVRSVQNRLEHLVQLGLASCSEESTYRYSPTTPELESLGGEIVRVYQARRTEFIELIYSKPLKEIMTFAEAFRIRGGKE